MALANCLPPLFALPEAKEHLLRAAPVEEVVVIIMGRCVHRPSIVGTVGFVICDGCRLTRAEGEDERAR